MFGLAFLTPTIAKYGAMAVALVALLFGAYSYGHSQGSESGYKKGVDDMKPTVDKLTKDINDTRQAMATKAASITKEAVDSVVAAKDVQAVKETVRTQIVYKYIAAQPAISVQCGWSAPTVVAINALLDTQIIPTAAESTPQPTEVVNEN